MCSVEPSASGQVCSRHALNRVLSYDFKRQTFRVSVYLVETLFVPSLGSSTSTVPFMFTPRQV